MRYLPLDGFASLSRRFHIFNPDLEYDRTLLTAGLFPPLPVCDDDLIWGFRILTAARNTGLKELPVIEISHDRRLLHALKLENRTGSYSWEERLAICLLGEELGDGEDRDAISHAVSGNRGFFSRIDRYRQLPDYLAARVNEGRLDLGIAEKVTEIPKAACDLVFSTPTLSFSQVRGFLINLSEIQRREAMSNDRVIAVTQELLSSSDPAAALGRIRNPGLSELTARFEAIKERYTEHSGVSLEAPKYFEGDAYTISFAFSTGLELQRKKRTIEKLEDASDELEDLL